MTLILAQRSTGLAPSVTMVVGSMLLVQMGAALSRPVVAEIGALGFTWLRLAAAAAVLMAVTRPRLRGLGRREIWAAFLLGAALATMCVAYVAAVKHLPLGLAATIAFLGPFSVAVLASRGWRPIALAVLAGVGVILSLDPWSIGMGSGWQVEPVGLVYAGIAAAGFAAYILLSRRVGQVFKGNDGLAISMLTAAVLLTPFGMGSLEHVPSAPVILGAAGLAVLSPLLTCWLEMVALRKLGTQVFSILLSLEPAIAAALGIVLLVELPNGVQTMGILCVIVASVAVVRLSSGGPVGEAERA